jgi:hypothetical protein
MSDLFEDLVDSFGPDEWLGVGVVVIDIELVPRSTSQIAVLDKSESKLSAL